MPNSTSPRSGISEMQRAIGRIEGKLDGFIEQMKIADDRGSKLEGRVRGLEKWQHLYSGASGIVGALLAAIGINLRAPS